MLTKFLLGNRRPKYFYKKAVLSQGNRAMQHVFLRPMTLCYLFQLTKARCRYITDGDMQSFVD